MSTIIVETVLREEDRCNSWNPIVNQIMEIPVNKCRDVKRARYLAAYRLLLMYMECDSKRLWCAKRKTEVEV